MPVVNCSDRGWGFKVAFLLNQREQVELINVDFEADKKPIEELCRLFKMTFEHDPETKTVRFSPISN
jgi:hypothetical protein